MCDTKVTHQQLLEKIIEHDDGLIDLAKSIDGINANLAPIVKGIRSIAFAFKSLLALGAGSAAVAAILVLSDRFNN